jgi:hypothetical protein
MWNTLIPTVIAASICLSVVNLAAEINKGRDARNLPGVELTAQRNGAAWVQSQRSSTTVGEKSVGRSS